jgi:hypothetical protein
MQRQQPHRPTTTDGYDNDNWTNRESGDSNGAPHAITGMTTQMGL